MSNPKTVVIGYGYAGRSFHSYLVGLTPGLTLHGISSRSAETRERIQQERGCKAYVTFEEVIADPEVDLVVLATPHDTHADLAMRALDAGKHVICAKPFIDNLEQARAVLAAQQRSGKQVMVGQSTRFFAPFMR
ncbi:MAG: Gfo/Idh/MocA family oxidoreductase, partial [Caldilineaceae bacterium]|nr:Gfo/Idh/MocA family oxidoreductase [Caldilineaceae bacterium]